MYLPYKMLENSEWEEDSLGNETTEVVWDQIM